MGKIVIRLDPTQPVPQPEPHDGGRLGEDLHRIAMAISRDQGTSFSEAVAQLLRRAIGAPGSARISVSEVIGLEEIHLGQTITSDDVRALDDEP